VKVEYHPLFHSEFNEATRYYLKNGGRELAERFIVEVEQALLRIAAAPLMCPIVFKNVRRLRLKQFKAFAIRYSYDEAAETVFIGSLIHGARDPSIGQDRFD
jgi:plasmid stabilization system protein ParE